MSGSVEQQRRLMCFVFPSVSFSFYFFVTHVAVWSAIIDNLGIKNI